MRISGLDQSNIHSLNLPGNMSKIGDRKSNLIFMYPLLFDKTLIKKYEFLVRDFQTAQFISQIKISNVLNITQAAIQGYGDTSTSNYVNPAEVLNAALSNKNNDLFQQALQTKLNNIQASEYQRFQNQNSLPSKNEYAYKLQEMRGFIKHQILTDPIYTGYRPAFSIITMENNLLDIPLIVGTKTYKIDTGALYWILFITLSNNDTSLNNINSVKAILDRIPKNKYLELLTNANVIPPVATKDETNIDKTYNFIRRDSDTALKKALNDFSKVAGSLVEFESDIGFSTSISSDAASFSTVMVESIAEKAEMKTKIAALVNQTIVSSVFPVIQTVNNLMVNPALEIDFNAKYQLLLTDLTNVLSIYIDSIVNLFVGKLSSKTDPNAYIPSQDDFIGLIQRNCNALKQLNPYSYLDKLNTIRMKYADINRMQNISVLNFAEELSTIHSALYAQSNTMVNMISQVTNTGEGSDITKFNNDLNTNIRGIIAKYFYVKGRQDNIYDPGHNDDPANPHPGRISVLFQRLFAGVTIGEVDTFMKSIEVAIAGIIDFIFLYSTLSYFCEFINVVKTKIDIRTKDVIEFPNYTLVIPIEYVNTLYFALASKNISDTLHNITDDKLNNFKLTETNVIAIVDAIITRLGVRNIVVIDSDRNEFYYRWSFSKRTIKLNESTIHNYIRAQSSITAAF